MARKTAYLTSMKLIPSFLGILLLATGCQLTDSHSSEPQILKTSIDPITYRIDGEAHPTWSLAPDLKPDRLEIECKGGLAEVAFITDMDSLRWDLHVGDTVQFWVLKEGMDSALTELVGVPQNVTFTDDFIKANQGKFNVDIPEVQELAHILVALSDIGQQDSNMVDMTTEYYQEVMAHFRPFMTHPAVQEMNEHITEVFGQSSYFYYYGLKMNACGYVFNEQGEIVEDGIIRKMGFGPAPDPIGEKTGLFEAFAGVSNFREFYADHQPYYDELIETYRSLNPIDKMQTWLEAKFPYSYGNYRTTFSPLVNGAHSTNRFEDNGFKQTVMFVCRADYREQYNQAVNEMIQSRIVFTEIDHNFVNPHSDLHHDRIDEAMSNRSYWADDEKPGVTSYWSPYAVFNEYMTFAVFSMYCMDEFEQADIDTFMPRMEGMMSQNRGFIQFVDFNQELMRVYQAQKDISMDELYDHMLTWCSARNAQPNG
ncbi:DUF4932 domain-containing protein [Pontibacter sp. G13]|uniref:DUF4932 domain-containing protein n=1 Tax=Pontibacter sp. G13 TaxID=3074898 RepID=UPI00288A9EB9|nr:DUF4932 domain-containing protein [Pontibacter sp. G13]WNJ18430.1 DUF4932 domain-containing protein [Pontibacter sp. G13]